MTNTQLANKIKSRVEVAEEIRGSIDVDTKLTEDKLATYLKEIVVNPTDVKNSHTTEAQRRTWERYLAVILICTADRVQAGRWILQELKTTP